MLYKNITRNLVTALAINMLTCEWPWSPYSYSEILKRVVTYYFMTRKALKRKGSIDVIFLRNYRGEFFFTFVGEGGMKIQVIAVGVTVGFSGGSAVKNLPSMQETQVPSLDQTGPLAKEMATHSSILA